MSRNYIVHTPSEIAPEEPEYESCPLLGVIAAVVVCGTFWGGLAWLIFG